MADGAQVLEQLQSKFPGLSLRLLASDSNPAMGQRVADARYSESSVKTLPPGWRDTAFIRQAKSYCLKTEFSSGIEFVQQDIRETIPDECFELVLCRNLVFTYFETDLQRSILERISSVLKPGGVLVIGVHERLPELIGGFSQWSAGLPVYRKTG